MRTLFGFGLTLAAASAVTLPAPLRPPGDSSAIVIPDFIGAHTGHRHTGHRIWLPDALTISGSNHAYDSKTAYPVLFMMGGQGATPATTVTNTLAAWKTAIQALRLPPVIIVFPNTTDPDDSIEGWGMNAADGSFPLEDMLRLDLTTYLGARTRGWNAKERRAMVGFSKGGYETLRFRAKFGISFAAAYVVIDSPRLDADLGGTAQTYAAFSSNEKLKLFGNNGAAPSAGSAACQAAAPCSTTAGTGLFNTLGNNAGGLGAAPLFMIESDPGGGAPATQAASMNNMINTRLGALSVTFTTTNLDNATFTPSHNLQQCIDAWNGEADATSPKWIPNNAAGFAVVP